LFINDNSQCADDAEDIVSTPELWSNQIYTF
jgi:hypothetical protein